MALKSSYYTKTQLDRLGALAKENEKTEAFLLREALDDLFKKYSR
jgi:predicted DNA-binding protein